ncbi:MAG: acyl transferase [Cytophagales bacterium]|nr:acyl transferase [Cytophagales bacterium]
MCPDVEALFLSFRTRALSGSEDRDKLVLEIFRYQARHNPIYAAYIKHLNRSPEEIYNLQDIPFLPIEMFRHFLIQTHSYSPEIVFQSSGTTQIQRSQHAIDKLSFYESLCQRSFEDHYGPLSKYTLYTLLPTYRENPKSSLLYMIKHFLSQAHTGKNMWDNYQGAFTLLKESVPQTMVWGLPQSLFNFSEEWLKQANPKSIPRSDTVFIETGGMKQGNPTLSKEEIYHRLHTTWQIKGVQSEYGMTECLSQAYGIEGIFSPPPWMYVQIRDLSDPFSYLPPGEQGGINIIDMMNIHSCCFLETQDRGRLTPPFEKGDFEVLGRVQDAPARGCHMLMN